MTGYRDVNQANWDERVAAHLAAPEYSVERFYADPGFLSGVVRFDTALLGPVATYVTTDVVFEHTVTHEWNHGLGEIVTALLDAGLTITGLAEHDSVPWDALPGLMTESGGEWRLTDTPARLPCSYTLQAVR